MNERRDNSDGNNIQGCSKDTDLLILSSDESCNEEDLPIEKTALKRLAIIDTLNLIHHCALLSPFAKIHNQKCDAIAVLLLARNLLKEMFDLRLYIPDSYMTGINREKVANHFILEEMQKLGYLGTITDHSHDDLILLEYAKCTGGFIISNDKYRDHDLLYSTKTKDKASLDVMRQRIVRYKFKHCSVDKLKGGKYGLCSAKNGNGYLGLDCVLQPPSLKAMFSWDRESDPTFGVVFRERAYRSQRKTEKALEVLDIMCEYFRLDFCYIHTLKPEPLPWFDPEVNQLLSFNRFWLRYINYVEEEEQKKKKIKQKKEENEW
ncbi:RNase_Zc3h12a domain-containing protein [Meloidogyne graminicola]|uniref:RNase_Zc3h12a domain-containing protein n=1 Tax=Meloidogyne graminicola TaxID=189291 RepID=A0A8S9ZKD4_9BILA|nr:RNase_Zc3h12a domain-containing protein [Meloidogyne graminicola]